MLCGCGIMFLSASPDLVSVLVGWRWMPGLIASV